MKVYFLQESCSAIVWVEMLVTATVSRPMILPDYIKHFAVSVFFFITYYPMCLHVNV